MTIFTIILLLAALTARHHAGDSRYGRYTKHIKAEVLGTAPRPASAEVPGPRYLLVCGYTDPVTKTDYRFRTEKLIWVGRPPLPGSSVTVHVEPNTDYRTYLIDLTSLFGWKASRPA